MQVSAVSADYSQISRALDSEKKVGKKDVACISNFFSKQNPLNKATAAEQDIVKKEIQNWKNFCHQQILKGKLDIIA